MYRLNAMVLVIPLKLIHIATFNGSLHLKLGITINAEQLGYPAALLFKGQFNNNEPFALELPPYRFPTIRQMVLRDWREVRHFLRCATKFINSGVVLVWILTNMPYGIEKAIAVSWSGWVGQYMAPILSRSGINPELTIALIFGFVAKESVIDTLVIVYGLEDTALCCLPLYTPCLSTIATIRAEAKST